MASTNWILIGNLPDGTDDTDVRGLVSGHGTVSAAMAFTIRFGGAAANLFLVGFQDSSDATDAASDLNGSIYNSHALVAYALPGGTTKLP